MYDWVTKGEWVDIKFFWSFVLQLMASSLVTIVPAGFVAGWSGAVWPCFWMWLTCNVFTALFVTWVMRYLHDQIERDEVEQYAFLQGSHPLPKEQPHCDRDADYTHTVEVCETPTQEQSYSRGYTCQHGRIAELSDERAEQGRHPVLQSEEITVTRRTYR